MKQQCVILAVILLIRIPAFAQPCLPQGITFIRQAQIDSFPITNPNCSEIQGLVYITGNNITNLNGLSSIVSVGADLYIRNTSALTNLSGLNNLTTVGNEISIGGNALLNSLDGLGGLEFVGYAFELDYNPSLNNLDGLNSLAFIGGYLMINDNSSLIGLSGPNALTTIGGTLNISNNPLLNSLSGLDNLTSTGDGLILSQNSSLTSLEGLSNLSMIGGSLTIGQNPVLSSLESLSALTSIEGGLWIQDNHILYSLAGLDNINANSITDLTISDNDSLSMCEVLSVCSYLSTPNGNVVVQGNSAGCNNVAEIETACQAISTPEKDLPATFLIYPNPADQKIFISSDYKGKINEVNIYNETRGLLLKNQPASNSIDVSILPAGFYIVELVLTQSIIRRKLVIK